MLSLAVLACLTAAYAYVWPSPQLDALEAMRWDQDGTTVGFATFFQPRDFFIFSTEENSPTGRANAPDWIRTVSYITSGSATKTKLGQAYHDMATHNVEDGTGGLDASIRFSEEQSRAQNAGDGFFNTLAVLVSFTSRYISLADLIAIGAITAIENCGGPEIAFRGGRIDSGEPNAPGVPEPQQDLSAHIASFARQGFTETEMIGLIACGHTFGGAQHAAFPDIVPELHDPTSKLDVAHFDSTFVDFDNNVATEYISGTTRNPLVVGLNDTTNSDKRIFASDGNATMLSFANSLDVFTSTCADLFARMLDTVPRGVELTDVIEPLPVKPDELSEVDPRRQNAEGGWQSAEDANHSVRLLWDDHLGGTHNVTLLIDSVSFAMGGRVSATRYFFNGTDPDEPFLLLDAAAGISSMRFTVDNKLENQGGIGFAMQDGVVFSNSSCLTSQDPIAGRFDIAVRNGLNPARVYLEHEEKDAVNRTFVVETKVTRPAQPVAANSAYSIWSINLTDESELYTIGSEVYGVKFSTPDLHSLSDFVPCTT
ncbi:heme peroxidase [Mycena vulgaris]|nr:heme peroxidase [Mycena vulgaris]